MNCNKVHRFENEVNTRILPERFTFPFNYEPHPLCIQASDLVMSYVAGRAEWQPELRQGKMLGVLVVQDTDDAIGFLAAFSGNLAGGVQHDYFVPPIYDLLEPDGEFKRGEAQISAINHEIERLQADNKLDHLRLQLEAACRERDAEVGAYRDTMAQSKRERDAARRQPLLSADEQRRLIAESQFQKAELKRIRRRWETEIAALQQQLDTHNSAIRELMVRRKSMSEALQERIFRLFVVQNARGERLDLIDVFARYYGKSVVPPSGAGECCAPRLLQYAFAHCLKPLCMAEFWYGNSPVGEVRRHGHYYPSCSSKCKPILSFMLQGVDVEPDPLATSADEIPIEVLYEDEWLLAVNKPAGMLSVPGKQNVESLPERLQRERGIEELYVVHRLDMATSGVLLLAKSMEVCKAMQRQFASRRVTKCYDAWLNGEVQPDEGEISLPLSPDFDHRPFQLVDYENGKAAKTRFEVVERCGGRTRVNFYPLTGRTHQLRVHAAHHDGLNAPIVGDALYGTADQRLMLHARSLTFTHPVTGKLVDISVASPF